MSTDRTGEPSYMPSIIAQEVGKAPAPLRVELVPSADQVMRQFGSGATRHSDMGKLDPEGFLSPHVLDRYCQYLDEHRTQADGKVRDSDNWQQGIPLEVYMKSQLRHTFSQWGLHREQSYDSHPETQKAHEDACCAVIFNAMGYLFELLRFKQEHPAGMRVHEEPPSPREALEETAYDD